MPLPSARDAAIIGVGQDGDFRVQLNAALNRGVAATPAAWTTPSAYFPPQTSERCTAQPTGGCRYNEYVKYLHSLAIDNLIYAMPKDDVQSQSGVQILAPSTDPPSRVTITIR